MFDLEAERNVRAGVVHVVALNALVHDAEAAANDRLAVAGQVIGKAETRTKVRPVIVHEALRNAVLFGDADAVQVERNAGENGIRAGAEAGAAPCTGSDALPIVPAVSSNAALAGL